MNNNIFLGELFIINNKGCLIMGYGKTSVCRYHTGDNIQEVALEHICITKSKNQLYGYVGLELEDKTEVNYFMRMLDQSETEAYFKDRERSIIEISMEDYIDICEFQIAYSKKGTELCKDNSKISLFRKLVSDKKVEYIIIPWCSTPEEKGELIRRYIK